MTHKVNVRQNQFPKFGEEEQSEILCNTLLYSVLVTYVLIITVNYA